MKDNEHEERSLEMNEEQLDEEIPERASLGQVSELEELETGDWLQIDEPHLDLPLTIKSRQQMQDEMGGA